MSEKEQRFKVGDPVRDIHDGSIGVVVEVQKDESWASGYAYLIDFGPNGNQFSDGSNFEKIV